MSHVADLVFILPRAGIGDHQTNRDRFELSFRIAHGWDISLQGGAGKAMSTSVYVAGVNWINHEWISEVCAADWPEGTVLWLDSEGLMDQPNERVVHQLGPKAGRS